MHVSTQPSFYYLPDDYREESDLADTYPKKVEELSARLLAACEGDFEHGIIGSHRALYDSQTAVDFLEGTRRQRHSVI